VVLKHTHAHGAQVEQTGVKEKSAEVTVMQSLLTPGALMP